jgi:hypothetical protein
MLTPVVKALAGPTSINPLINLELLRALRPATALITSMRMSASQPVFQGPTLPIELTVEVMAKQTR